MLWSCAAIEVEDRALLTSITGALHGQLLHNLNGFDSRSLANMLWAFSTIAFQPGHMLMRRAIMVQHTPNPNKSMAQLQL